VEAMAGMIDFRTSPDSPDASSLNYPLAGAGPNQTTRLGGISAIIIELQGFLGFDHRCQIVVVNIISFQVPCEARNAETVGFFR